MPSSSHTHATPTRPEVPGQAPALHVQTPVHAGAFPISTNHRQTLARPPSLTVKTHVKAGSVLSQLDGSSKEAA